MLEFMRHPDFDFSRKRSLDHRGGARKVRAIGGMDLTRFIR
jgi:hypothetical protein